MLIPRPLDEVNTLRDARHARISDIRNSLRDEPANSIQRLAAASTNGSSMQSTMRRPHSDHEVIPTSTCADEQRGQPPGYYRMVRQRNWISPNARTPAIERDS